MYSFQKKKKEKKKKFQTIFQSILSRMDKCNLFLSTNVLLFYVLTILIHHFALLFSIISQKKLSQKEILSQSAWFFFRIFCRMDIYFKRPIIYQSGITMNTSATITVLPNFQFNLIFSVLKKSCKNEYICSSNVCLTDIITSSRINVIIFFINDFFCLLRWLKVTSVFI